RIFGTEGNEVILKDFLSSIIEEPIKEIEVKKDMKLEKEDLNDKVGILDIKAKLDNGTQVNVEMQVVNQQNMEKRTLFYWGKLYTGSIHEGEAFYGLKKTITINLLDFNYFDTKQYHTKWHIVEDKEKDNVLTDVLEIHFIELKKFIKEEKKPQNKKEEWLYFLDYTKKGMVEMLAKKNKVIEKAQEELQYLTGDAAIKRKAELREKWIRDYKGSMEYAKQEGLRQGIEEGRKEGREEGIEQKQIEVIKEMLKLGMDKQTIGKITKVEINEIEKIENLLI
ncbi:MAG: Rpn family recombination-promoting nuclease/putative transposase, partial [Clostridia bacterium]|nr:Rpn family recombination-promoting nuclease/putative transposase [Clostridia bacterium]